MTSTPHVHERPVSAIKIYTLIEQRIKKIKSYPLTSDNLIVQQDAYRRLATEDNESAFEVFASLEQSHKEKDTDLRFIIQFGQEMFILGIEGVNEDMLIRYSDVAATDKEIADHIIAALCMLANGQLFCIHTTRNGMLCAIELAYRETPDATPILLSLDGKYPHFVGSDDPSAYDVHVLRNNFQVPASRLPQPFFLGAQTPGGAPLEMPRQFEGNTITPLTKTAYKSIINAVGNLLMGAKDDEDFAKKANKSWLFWLILIGLGVPAILLIPDSAFIFAGPLAGLVIAIIAGYAAGRYLVYLEKLRSSQPNHKLLKLEALITLRRIWMWFFRLCLCLALLSTWPLFMMTATSPPITLLQLSQYLGPIAILPAIGAVGALLLSFFQRTAIKITAGITAALSAVGLFIVNSFTYTADDTSNPEPFVTIALTTYVTQLILAVGIIIFALRHRPIQASE